jgi:hypothetical protein
MPALAFARVSKKYNCAGRRKGLMRYRKETFIIINLHKINTLLQVDDLIGKKEWELALKF